MRAQELRIGNLLMWEDESEDIIAMKDIILRDNYYSVSFDGGYAQLDEFIPIKLTEGWLKKLGFKSTGVWGDYSNEKLLICSDLKDDGSKLIYSGEYYFKHGNNRVPLKYIHQLQNLYFALTGKELIAKKTK